MVVGDDDRAVAQGVVKQVARVELYGLAEDVFYCRFPSRGADVGPAQESLLVHRLSLVGISGLLLVFEPFLVSHYSHLAVEGFHHQHAVTYVCRIAEGGEHLRSFLFSLCNHLCLGLCLTWNGECGMLPRGETPD